MWVIGATGMVLLVLSYSVFPTCWYKEKHRLQRKKGHQEESGKRVLYLTFDDGPDGRYTPQLLDLLKKYEIVATFFVVGEFVKENPELIWQMVEQGHEIGLHSFAHKNGLWQTPSCTKKDFRESLDMMNILDIPITFVRPPWGHLNLAMLWQIKRHQFKPVLWDVMAQDWRGHTTAEKIAQKLTTRVETNSIICLHDGRGKKGAPARTIRALEEMIPLWLEEGYEFRTMGQYDDR